MSYFHNHNYQKMFRKYQFSNAPKSPSMVGGECFMLRVGYPPPMHLQINPNDLSQIATAEGVLRTAFWWRKCFSQKHKIEDECPGPSTGLTGLR